MKVNNFYFDIYKYQVLIHRNQARSIKIGWFVLKYSIEFQNQNNIGLTVPPI